MVAMVLALKRFSRLRIAAAAGAICLCVAFTGCRKTHVGHTALAPGKSGPIKDLTAIRVGDEVTLNWTAPRRHISKVSSNGSIKMRVCLLEMDGASCTETGSPLILAPGTPGTFSTELPALMRSGFPRAAYYAVELLDPNAKPTGLVNRVPVLVGAAPPPVDGLIAEATARGVVLLWNPLSPAIAEGDTAIRLRRTEGPDPIATQAMRDGLVPFPARPEVELSAADGTAGTLDADTHKGTTYQYRAQRIFRIVVDGQTLEMDGPFSSEVQVNLPGEPH